MIKKLFSPVALFLLIIVLISLVATVLLLGKSGKQNFFARIPDQLNLTDSIESSPSPFQELTIPSLRKKSFQSQLTPLRQVSQNNEYTSYLTSYDSDGLNINGLLTIPAGTEPEGGWPAIVFIHGYIPPDEYRTQEKYVAYVNYLARNKFVVFKIDLRGHDKSEGEPGGAYYSADYVIDALNAYAALHTADFVHPDQIGLWGHSMAGNVVLRAVAAKPTIPAAVIWAGAGYTYADLQEYRIQDRSYQPPASTAPRQQRRQQLFNTFGQFDPTNQFWKQVVATNYLSDFTGAIQLHHAVNDQVVDVRYSRNLNQILDGTSIPHELHEYPQGGHNIEGTAFNTAMARTVNFFDQYLK
jgi:uncharacterized protein